MIDAPNERSNHDRLVVTGVGVGFVSAALSFLVVVNAAPAMIVGAILLLVISVMDDRRSLAVTTRFGFQLIAVILAIHIFDGQVFQGLLPVWLDMIVTAILWLWMINLTNFMDGIDEMTVTQVSCMTGGLVLLGLIFSAIPHGSEVDALVILVAVVTFYPWNKHPARCFMGDAGSVPLGYLMGYLMFSLAAAGQWQIALILPAYYMCDATITLMKRAVRKQPIWQAHSEHFYQQAVRSGYRHDHIARHVLLVNIALIIICAIALNWPHLASWMLLPAYAIAAGLCYYFSQMKLPQERGLLPHEVAA